MTERPPKNPAIAWFRFFIWLMPTVVCALLFSLMLVMRFAASPLFMIAAVAATFGLGYFDGNLKCQQQQLDQSQEKGLKQLHAIKFLIAQVLVIPALGGGVIYGICLLAK